MATVPATQTPSGMDPSGVLLAEELLEIAERAQNYTSASGAAIALVRPGGLVVRTSEGIAPEVGTRMALDEGIAAACVRTNTPQTCADVEMAADAESVLRSLRLRSAMAIPVQCGGAVKAVLMVCSQLPQAFNRTHVAILMTLRDVIGSKLHGNTDLLLTPFGGDKSAPASPVAPARIEPARTAPEKTAAQPAKPNLPAMPKAAAVEVVPPNVETAEEPASSRSATLASAPASLTVAPDLSELRAAILSKHEEPVNAKQPEVLCAAENLGTPVKPKPAKPVRVAAPAVPVNFIELEKMQSPAERPRAPFLIAASVVVVLFAAVGVHFYGGLHRASATEPISLSAPITPAPGAAPLASPAEPTPDNTKVQVPPKSTTQPSPVAAQAPQSKLAPQFQPQVITPPVTVMELAPSQPKPKAEVAENLEAPALESGGSGLPSLPAAAAAMPNISVQKSSVVPAELIQRVAPVYPLAARSLGVKGTVSLVATISVTGEVSAVRVVSGDQVLRQAAVDAVKRWRYRPATLNGAPTESTAEVTLNFTSPR